MSFENYFKSHKEGIIKNKIVIILGSGFHREAYPDNSNNPLTSWPFLLKQLGNIADTGSAILNFEQLVIKKTGRQNAKIASTIENKILSKCVQHIKNEQNLALEKHAKKYPLGIFDPNYISDVISLNFDLVPEILLSNQNPGRNLNRSFLKTNRYRSIGGINFWHPHGDIDSYHSLILGLRKYGNCLKDVEKMRTHFKGVISGYEATWFHKIMTKPVLILGADLSFDEWDILFALVNRARNTARGKNKKFKLPIFKMKDPCINQHHSINSLFNDIARNRMPFTEQWKLIIELFKKGK